MKCIYEAESIRESESKYITEQSVKSQIEKICDRISDAKEQLETFKNRIVVRSDSYDGS